MLFPLGAQLDQNGQLATFEVLVIFNKEFTWLKRLPVSDWFINCVFFLRGTSTEKAFPLSLAQHYETGT